MGFKTISNPTGAFGYSDLETEVAAATIPLYATAAVTAGRCVAINTTGTGVATAATDGTASLVVGVAVDGITSGSVGLVTVFGMAENVGANGTIGAGDLVKRSVTSAGYVAATATPAVGEVVGVAVNASASNTVDVWVRPGALS